MPSRLPLWTAERQPIASSGPSAPPASDIDTADRIGTTEFADASVGSAAIADNPVVIAVVIVCWVSTGLVIAWFMARRGHSATVWSTLGVLLGPLAAPLAIHDARDEPAPNELRLLRSGDSGPGFVDVIVEAGGDPDALAARVRSLVAELGSTRGRITVAYRISYEDLESESPGPREERAARDRVEELCRRIEDLDPQAALVAGPPARALAEHARAVGYEALVRACGESETVVEWLDTDSSD